MKTTVSCDLVFDVLTRGPFPTGHADDALVEQHLATCHECRNLADALRPAVDLFHECLIADDQLPQYEGRLPAPRPAAHDAIMAAVREVEAERPRMGVFNLETIRLILTVAAVVMLAVLVVDHFGGDEDARRISRMSSARQPDEIGVQLLVSLKLAKTCYESVTPAADASAVVSPLDSEALSRMCRVRYLCCTECHHSRDEVLDQDAGRRLLHSCQACHDQWALAPRAAAFLRT